MNLRQFAIRRPQSTSEEGVSALVENWSPLAAEESERKAGQTKQTSPLPASQDDKSQSNRKPHLLIVEDNRGDVLLVEEAIKLHNVDVHLHVVEDGEEACSFIERADQDPHAPCPGLLLLDLNLPKKTGLEVLQRVRESQRCRNIPVVIFTSSNSPQDRNETSRLGADRYFQKPTRYEQFLKIGQVLKEVLEQSRKG